MMKFACALILVVVAMTTAEPPRPRLVVPSRQTAPPYNARGWRPSGPAFNLPLTSQAQVQQTYGAPAPAPSYGPPPESVPSDAYPTDQPTTTEYPTENPTNQFLVEAENIELDPREDKQPKPKKKTGKEEDQPKASLLLFLPQKQNLLYAAAPKTAPLVTVPQSGLARLQTVPAPIQFIPYSAAVSSSVFTPYSASYVQLYQ